MKRIYFVKAIQQNGLPDESGPFYSRTLAEQAAVALLQKNGVARTTIHHEDREDDSEDSND